jgi:hypothetical protein
MGWTQLQPRWGGPYACWVQRRTSCKKQDAKVVLTSNPSIDSQSSTMHLLQRFALCPWMAAQPTGVSSLTRLCVGLQMQPGKYDVWPSSCMGLCWAHILAGWIRPLGTVTWAALSKSISLLPCAFQLQRYPPAAHSFMPALPAHLQASPPAPLLCRAHHASCRQQWDSPPAGHGACCDGVDCLRWCWFLNGHP